ncbi:NAD(P)-dependent oxidoreductase [Algivirga pacifica]|uniref:Saccharopine dehydrogenase [NAD(+), L-lysine-forming] n=1 Tax=Algivirga pacifica TaxID=1162670 RepID=A0ABP9DE08_9BACT
MKIGIIREGKTPPDTRVLFTPEQCSKIKDTFPSIDITVQPSTIRCYQNEQYINRKLPLQEELMECDLLAGIKEVPINELVPNKTYMFFSHTIKKQSYNRDLLRAVLQKNIRLIDYECLTDNKGQRVIAFGRFAGLVGAYNGLIAYGKRTGRYELKPAHQCEDLKEMKAHCAALNLPAIKVAVTGGGRVSDGIVETLQAAGFKEVGITEYLEQTFDYPVYVQLRSKDYHTHQERGDFKAEEFYSNPSVYQANFTRFLPHTDLLVAGAFWHHEAPVLFTKEDLLAPENKLKIIADVTCDIEGSIPSTIRPSTIDNPFYDYDPASGEECPAFSSEQNITVMAVDNLPNELPKDASASFGDQMLTYVLPNLLNGDKEGMIKNATITSDGQLTNKFAYLQDYVDGKE